MSMDLIQSIGCEPPTSQGSFTPDVALYTMHSTTLNGRQLSFVWQVVCYAVDQLRVVPDGSGRTA